MSDGSKAPSLGDVVSAAAFVIALVTAWLYVAGWSYALDYFDRFRVPLLLAEIPREHLFVYGGLTLWKNLAWSLALAPMALGLSVAAVSFPRLLGRGGLTLTVVVAVVGLFVLARLAGVTTAAADASTQRALDFPAYPRVVVDLASEANGAPLATFLAEGCSRLLLATADRLFLIAPRRSAPALELHTTIVRWRDVRSVTMSGRYQSCD